MVQSDIVQVNVAFLTYNPRLCVDRPSVEPDNSCVVGLEELKKHRDYKRREKESMGPEAYHHYKWYNSMLTQELRAASENSKLKVVHWHIESGNTEAFTMGNVLYRAVSIIVGTEMEHWYCANTGKDGSHSFGSRYRNNKQQHEKNIEKIACFTIDDDEGMLVIKPRNKEITKCSDAFCANNCIKCKKFKSPFTKTNKNSTCVCFPSKEEFTRFSESDLEIDSDSEDPDIAHLPTTFSGKRGKLSKKFNLSSIGEESIYK